MPASYSPYSPDARSVRDFDIAGSAVLFIALCAVAARLYVMATTHRTVEDFFIILRYAENLARGRGFVYNPGEHVLGTTTPLYTLFLALVARSGCNPILWGRVLNILADGLSCVLIYRLARATGRPDAGLIAAAMLVAWPPDLYWAVSGMETALVTMAGLAVFVSLVERRPFAMAAWASFLVLLRIDGLLLALVAFAALLLSEWRVESRGQEGHPGPLPESRVESNGPGTPESGKRDEWREAPSTSRSEGRGKRTLTLGLDESKSHSRLTPGIYAILLFIALLLPWTVFALVYFGSPIPTSLLAKLSVYAWQNKGVFPNLRPFATQMAHNAFYAVFTLGIIPGLWLAVKSLRGLLPAAVWMLFYYAGMAFSKSFLFGWYYVPPAPILVLFSVLGWTSVLQKAWQTIRPRPAGAATSAEPHPSSFILHPSSFIAAGLVLLAGMAAVPKQRAAIARDQREDEGLLKPIGLALREIVQPDQRMMLEPIGWIGYYSGARVLDAVGLVSPEIIPYFRMGAVSPYLDIMAGLKPDYVLLRAGEYHDALAAPVTPDRALFSHYELVRTFPLSSAPSGRGPAFFLLRRRESGR